MTSVPAEILAGAAAKLLEFGRLDLARTLAQLALSENSGCANAHSVLAVVCETLAQWHQGLEHGRRAVKLLPDAPQLRYNLALSTLRLGDYPAGFALMEARIDKPDWTALAIAPSRGAPPPAATGRPDRGPAYSGGHRAGSRRLHHVRSLSTVACRAWSTDHRRVQSAVASGLRAYRRGRDIAVPAP